MPETVRLGFIGVGGIANHHLNQLKAIPGVTFAAFCDVNEAAVAKAVETHGGHGYADHRVMYDREELDGVYVCIPPKYHTDQEILGAQKGCALFVEKPVALSMDKALEVQEAVTRAGVLSSVGYTMRYWAGVCAAKEYLDGKRISMISCNRWGGVAGGEEHWWRVMDVSGGQLVEQATHQVDAIRWLAGDIRAVWARYEYASMAHLPKMSIPASQAFCFETAGGACGVMSCSCATYKGGGGGSWDFLLDGERVVVEGMSAKRLPPPDGTDGALGSTLEAMSIDEGFVRALQSGDGSTIRSTYADAVRTLEVTLAANESAASGRVVECTAWR
ncbi:MAG: Gfo/Idh/MocA family oxidoreductase [Armatimonadetes bacterium]|nr:Gfo/Idh/MocA family oxidoreductase [Armatimonadota bacterium]